MRNWKKKMLREFDEALPPLSEKVRRAGIPVVATAERDLSPSQEERAEEKRAPFFSGARMRFVALAAVFLLVCCGVIGVLFPSSSLPAGEQTVRFYSLEVNPAVLFMTDGDGIVTGAKAANADADAVFVSAGREEAFLGKTFSEAAALFVGEARKLGYFNYEKGAVRIGSEEGDTSDTASRAAESLRTAFREDGLYAVVAEGTIEEGERYQTVFGTAEGAERAEAFVRLSDLFGMRLIPDGDGQDIADVYSEYAVRGQLFSVVTTDFDAVRERVEILSRMSELNDKIAESPENPCVGLVRDYWTVKWTMEIFRTETDGTFVGMIEEMDRLVAEYDAKFGTVISSATELATAEAFYSFFADEEISEFLRSLTSISFDSSAERAIDLLRRAGFESDGLEALLRLPTTVEEYAEKIGDALGELVSARRERFRFDYEKQRDKISESDYGVFVRSLEEEYGSLLGYWNFLYENR